MISIVLPAYNEEKNIKKTVDSIFDFFIKKDKLYSELFEIIVVNDGSKDKTADILDGYKSIKNVQVISHQKNLGYGAALRSGFDAAKGDLIFFTDSDCQFDIKDIDDFLKEIKNYDFVIGYRKNRKDSQVRIFNGFLLRLAARFLFGVKVRDVDCAFKLFKKEVIKSLILSENGALINLEILALAQKKHYKFLELPVSHFYRTEGNPTGGNLKVIFLAAYNLLGLWMRINIKFKND